MNNSARKSLEAAYDRWIAAAQAGDAEGYASMFSDEGVLMPPNGRVVRGRQQIRQWAAEFYRKYKLDASGFTMEAQMLGEDLAYSRYSACGRYVPLGNEQGLAFDQKYLDVLVRRPDGSWRMAAHMWSSNAKGPSIWA